MSLKTLTERFEEVNKIKENNKKIDKAVFNIEDVGDLLNSYKNLKEIEQSHQEENGKLRVELEQEKEKNKKLEEYITDKIEIEDEIQTYISEKFVEDQYISKDKIKEKIKMYKLVYNSVSARTLELLLEEK